MFNIVTLTPKFFSVCCSLFAVARRCVLESPMAFLEPCFNRETGGNTYGAGCFCAGFTGSGGAVFGMPATWLTSESIPSNSFASSYSYVPSAVFFGESACTGISPGGSLSPPSTSPIKISGSSSAPTGRTGICSVFCTSGISAKASGRISQISSPAGFLPPFFLPEGISWISVSNETPFAFLSTRRAARSCCLS